ncbi:zinc finger protein 592-like isoform X2 [Frankliniella occidentalis]|nr:zinc finger protein 592-like isoform X2 [Frankliniella occidentalis]
MTDTQSSTELPISSCADNFLWKTPNCVPEIEDGNLNQVNNNGRPPVICANQPHNRPANQTIVLDTDKTGKKETKMSNCTSIKDEENTSDDIEDLLSMKVSKDYINCVWTNEPQSSNTSNVQRPPEKLVIPDATASSEDADSSVPPAKHQSKIPDKKVNSKTLKKKKKIIISEGDAVAPLKKVPMKARDKLNRKIVTVSQRSVSNSSIHNIPSKLHDNAKKISKNSDKPVSLHMSKISTPSPVPTLNRLQDNVDSSLFVAYKNLVVQRSIPLYKPKQNDVRFFKGSYFDCKACGDRFVLETSLTCHMRRKTSKFSYRCPVCKIQLLFDNRCILLLHIMSHEMDADNLHPEDLLCLPLSENENECEAVFRHTSSNSYKCPECFGPVISLKLHFQGEEPSDFTPTNRPAADCSLKCKECAYTLPTKCALTAHERFHMMKPPHLCPDCGEVFLNSSILLNHMEEECLHHLKCSLFECSDCNFDFAILSSFTDHFVEKHLQIFFVCHICGDKVDSLKQLNKHRLNKHKLADVAQNSETANLCTRVVCDKCPDLNISLDMLQDHAASHTSDGKSVKTVYQCENCKIIFSSKTFMLNHKKDCPPKGDINCTVVNQKSVSQELLVHAVSSPMHAVPRDVNDSVQILPQKPQPALLPGNSSPGNEIDVSPNNCKKPQFSKVNPLPNRSQDILVSDVGFSKPPESLEKKAVCKLCKKVVSVVLDTAALKEHFSTEHLDIFLNAVHQEGNNRLSLQSVSTRSKEAVSEKDKKAVENFLICLRNNDFTMTETKIAKKKAGKGLHFRKSSCVGRTTQAKVSSFECYKCMFKSENSESFKTHILSHKSNPSDLQCPQCGLCFIVRPPLEKHLIVGHGIKNVNKYLIDHGFQDRTSDGEEDPVDVESLESEELQENQCTVCRQKFETAFMLQKHFRVHGGAFLLAKLKARQSSQ